MEILELKNPLDLDFKFEQHDVTYKNGSTIKDYFPELEDVVVIVNGNNEVPIDYIIGPNDTVVFSRNLRGSDGAKMAFMAIAIVAIAIITWGVGGAIAGGAAAGGSSGAGAAGGSTALGDMALIGDEIAAITATEAAGTTAGFGSGFLTNLGLMAGSMVLNMLLAPKAPDSTDQAPERSVYLWSDYKTQSQQMIPIPICLGRFPLYGNLVAARTESQNHKSVFEPLYDTGYFIYGLCSNELTGIDEIYINELPASEMEDEDISIFYTKGAEDQSFLYALEESTTTENGVTRFNGLDNSPLVENEALVPGLIVENVYNETLQQPEHAQYNAILPTADYMSWGEVQEFEGIFVGRSDINGNIETDPNIYPTDYEDLPFYCVVRKHEYEWIDDELAGFPVKRLTDEVYAPTFGYTDGFLIFETPWTDSYTMISSMPLSRNSCVLKFEYVKTVNTYDHVVQITYYSTGTRTIEPDDYVLLANKKEVQVETIDDFLDPYTVNPASSNAKIITTTTGLDIDEFVLEFIAPQGLFCIFKKDEETVRDYGCWLSFEYIITEYSAPSTPTGKTALLTAEGIRKFHTSEAGEEVVFNSTPNATTGLTNQGLLGYLANDNQQPIMWQVKATDIIRHHLATDIDGGTTNKITLTDGKLTGDYYTCSVRIYDHGVACNSYSYRNQTTNLLEFRTYARVLDDDMQERFSAAEDGEETIVNNVALYRVKEYRYTANATYPQVSCMGLCINATEELNNTLPQITVIGKNKILTWDGTTDTEEEYSPSSSHWSLAYSPNPAYICLHLLYDSFCGASIGGYESDTDKLANFISKVDVPAFCAFAEWCDEPIDIVGIAAISAGEYDGNPEFVYDSTSGTYKPKRYVCNGTVDTTGTVLDWMNKILGSYDARIFFKGRKLSIIWDQEYSTSYSAPVQVFSNSNIIAGSFQQSYLNAGLLANVIETTYMDEDNGFEKTPIVYMPYQGFAINPDQKTSINVFGHTNKYRVQRRLNEVMRKTNLLTKVFEFSTSMSGFTLEPGNLIGINHEFIEWGNVSPNDIQTSGRIVSIDGTTQKIVVDKKLYQQNDDVDLTDKWIFIQSTNEDNDRLTLQLAGNSIDNYTTTLDTKQTFDDTGYTVGDMYILGETSEQFKYGIVTDVTINGMTVKVKCVEYVDDIFTEDYILSDIAGSTFPKEDCTPRDLEARYEYGPDKVYVTWSPPKILKPGYPNDYNAVTEEYDHVAKTYDISLVKYLIYRKKKRLVGDSTSDDDASKWVLQGESKVLSFEQNWDELNYTFFYKVVPVININMYENVKIPISWCNETQVELYNSSDYISKPKILNSVVTQNPNFSDMVDYTIYLEKFTDLHPTRTNFILVWAKHSDSSDESWLGTRSITLKEDAIAFDSYIDVTSITGLPLDATDTDSVKGLVILNDEEIVYVSSSSPITGGHRLQLYYNGENSIGRRYALGTNQSSGVSVKNAHLGFYPVVFFGTQELNGITESTADSYITTDSLFYYDYDTGYVSEVDTTGAEAVALIQTIGLEPQYWRITSGYNDLISIPSNTTGIVGSKFMIDTNIIGSSVVDFSINRAFKTADGASHVTIPVGLATHSDITFNSYTKSYGANVDYFTITEIPKSGYTWLGITHAETVESGITRGYTSYVVDV